MSPPRGTVFLERGSYRRRRVMDGARILPVAGFVLILLPVLWAFDNGANIAAEAVYLFALWTALIVAAAILARPLRHVLKREKYPPDAPVPAATTPEADPANSAETEPDPDAGETAGIYTDPPAKPHTEPNTRTPAGPEPGR